MFTEHFSCIPNRFVNILLVSGHLYNQIGIEINRFSASTCAFVISLKFCRIEKRDACVLQLIAR